jgi:hypothetical protein
MSDVINESFGDVIASLEHSTPINNFLFSHLVAIGFLPVLIDTMNHFCNSELQRGDQKFFYTTRGTNFFFIPSL